MRWHLFESDEPVEDDELDVIVALLDDELYVAGGGCLDGGGGAGERDQGAGRLVPDRGAGRVEQVVDTPDEASAL